MVSYISAHTQLPSKFSIFLLLFTEETNTDIDNVFGKPLFNDTDCEWMKANSDSVMRKQIKSIENSKILTKQNH